MHSCLYEGRVMHERRMPVHHRFQYRLFMIGLDLGELDQVFRGRWLWSTRRPAPVWFRRKDYFGDVSLSLESSVRDLVEKEKGRRPEGRILLITHLRTLGFAINPISIYLCFSSNGKAPETAVLEVTNTPWGETRLYVIDLKNADADTPPKAPSFDKTLHVSPFMGMDYRYSLRVDYREESLRLELENHGLEGVPFVARLGLRRRTISGANLAWMLVMYPFMTLRIFIAIYFQAARLAWKRVPFHSHPRIKTIDQEAPQS